MGFAEEQAKNFGFAASPCLLSLPLACAQDILGWSQNWALACRRRGPKAELSDFMLFGLLPLVLWSRRLKDVGERLTLAAPSNSEVIQYPLLFEVIRYYGLLLAFESEYGIILC